MFVNLKREESSGQLNHKLLGLESFSERKITLSPLDKLSRAQLVCLIVISQLACWSCKFTNFTQLLELSTAISHKKLLEQLPVVTHRPPTFFKLGTVYLITLELLRVDGSIATNNQILNGISIIIIGYQLCPRFHSRGFCVEIKFLK